MERQETEYDDAGLKKKCAVLQRGRIQQIPKMVFFGELLRVVRKLAERGEAKLEEAV